MITGRELNDATMRNVGIGLVAYGLCMAGGFFALDPPRFLMNAGLYETAAGQLVLELRYFLRETEFRDEVLAFLLGFGFLLPVVGTYLYRRASGAGWRRVVFDLVVAMVPVAGPLLILTHTILHVRGVAAAWVLRTPTVLSVLLLSGVAGYPAHQEAMDYVQKRGRESCRRAESQKYDGQLHQAIGNYREGLRWFLDKQHGKAECQFDLGDTLSLVGDDEGAIAAYREAVRLEPDAYMYHRALAVALEGAGKGEEALAAYREMVRRFPSAYGLLWLGDALKRRGDLEGARHAYREGFARAQSPLRVAMERTYYDKGKAERGDLEYRLKMAWMTDEDADWAVAWSREVVMLDPTLAAAHAALGYVLAWKNDFTGAVAAYREAIRLRSNLSKSDLSEIYSGLGTALKQQGDREGAALAFRAAAQLKPPGINMHSARGKG